jgi:hypothetical protein
MSSLERRYTATLIAHCDHAQAPRPSLSISPSCPLIPPPSHLAPKACLSCRGVAKEERAVEYSSCLSLFLPLTFKPSDGTHDRNTLIHDDLSNVEVGSDPRLCGFVVCDFVFVYTGAGIVVSFFFLFFSVFFFAWKCRIGERGGGVL